LCYELEQHGREFERISEWVKEISLDSDSRHKELNKELTDMWASLDRIRTSSAYLSLVTTVGIIGIVAILGTLRHWF
jgi:hypothetical protein